MMFTDHAIYKNWSDEIYKFIEKAKEIHGVEFLSHTVEVDFVNPIGYTLTVKTKTGDEFSVFEGEEEPRVNYANSNERLIKMHFDVSWKTKDRYFVEAVTDGVYYYWNQKTFDDKFTLFNYVKELVENGEIVVAMSNKVFFERGIADKTEVLNMRLDEEDGIKPTPFTPSPEDFKLQINEMSDFTAEEADKERKSIREQMEESNEEVFKLDMSKLYPKDDEDEK